MKSLRGKFNYQFSLQTESNIFYLASNLVAEARDPDTNLLIPSKCRWFRIRGEKAYNLNAITGNVYQLSAEDVACKIKVELTPLEDEEDWDGTATAEFGPVALEPSMR